MTMVEPMETSKASAWYDDLGGPITERDLDQMRRVVDKLTGLDELPRVKSVQTKQNSGLRLSQSGEIGEPPTWSVHVTRPSTEVIVTFEGQPRPEIRRRIWEALK